MSKQNDVINALADMFALIDEGFLVRDISHDHEPDWAFKTLRFAVRLAKNKQALERELEQGKSEKKFERATTGRTLTNKQL